MPADKGVRLDDRQRIANFREQPIETNEYHSVEGAEGEFLWSSSPQNVDLLMKQGANACPVRQIPAAEIERIVIEQIRSLLQTPEIIVQTWRAARKTDRNLAESDVRAAPSLSSSRSGMSCSRPSRPASLNCWSNASTFSLTASTDCQAG
jgi:hypothetical protein